MKLVKVIRAYVSLKQSMGWAFRTEEAFLKSFSASQGDIDINQAIPRSVLAFIQGKGPLTSTWHHKFYALNGFYRFAISRGYATNSPLPLTKPKRPPPCAPYIYTKEELRRLLSATALLDNRGRFLPQSTLRLFLLFLYGTGLRVGEAMSITLRDVDLERRLLTIRCSKFYKSRLVPIGSQLEALLEVYSHERRYLPLPRGKDSAFFATRQGLPIQHHGLLLNFRKLCELTGIKREAASRRQPCIHDLRHTFAHDRLVSWYRSGADVQRLLPQLSTYLGHLNISGTQRYLSMTPELLQEVNSRFERYALSEVNHVK